MLILLYIIEFLMDVKAMTNSRKNNYNMKNIFRVTNCDNYEYNDFKNNQIQSGGTSLLLYSIGFAFYISLTSYMIGDSAFYFFNESTLFSKHEKQYQKDLSDAKYALWVLEKSTKNLDINLNSLLKKIEELTRINIIIKKKITNDDIVSFSSNSNNIEIISNSNSNSNNSNSNSNSNNSNSNSNSNNSNSNSNSNNSNSNSNIKKLILSEKDEVIFNITQSTDLAIQNILALMEKEGMKEANVGFKLDNKNIMEGFIRNKDGVMVQVKPTIKFKCPNLIYIDSDILDSLGYNENMWKAIIDMNGSKEIHNDIVIIPQEIQFAMWNVQNGNMTYDDLLTFLMHPENLEKIGMWINVYMDKNGQVKENFIQELYNYIRTLGYSHLYAKATIEAILSDMKKI